MRPDSLQNPIDSNDLQRQNFGLQGFSKTWCIATHKASKVVGFSENMYWSQTMVPKEYLVSILPNYFLGFSDISFPSCHMYIINESKKSTNCLQNSLSCSFVVRFTKNVIGQRLIFLLVMSLRNVLYYM